MVGISNNIEELMLGIYLPIAGVLTLQLRRAGRLLNVILGWLGIGATVGGVILALVREAWSFGNLMSQVGSASLGVILCWLFIRFFSRSGINSQFH